MKQHPEWKLSIGDGRGELREITSLDLAHVETDGGRTVWSGFAEFGPEFRVETVRRTGEDGLELFALSYSGYAGQAFIEEIFYPIVRRPYHPGVELVHCPFDMGFRRSGKSLFPAGYRGREAMCGMQFAALIDAEHGNTYLDCRDPEHNVKWFGFAVSEDGGEIECAAIYALPLGETPAESGRIPYESAVASFAGGWYEAARLYRSWALEQPWHRNASPGNPLREIGLWVWNRGLAAEALPPVERLQRDLPGVPVALDWYWWHHNPYDTDYPDFWPPREGEEAFRRQVEKMTAQGIFTQVYVNGVCWDLDTPSFAEGGGESIVVKRDGEPLAYEFNKYNHHRLGFMCGEAPKFQERIAGLVARLRSCGLSGQYLDMIGNSTYNPCYNPLHRHAKGGGSASVRGYRAMLERLRRENPGYPLSTECANEAYMDLVAGAIICNSTAAERLLGDALEPLPLFPAVYHGRLALFGSYALPDGVTPWDPLWPPEDRWQDEKPWHRLYPEQFYVETARPVVWGAQPMVCNLTPHVQEDREYAELYRFLLESARFYHANRDLLFDGEMLSPDGFRCEIRRVKFQRRMIFTRENGCGELERELPALLHSVWRAPSGAKALILANYTAEPQNWEFDGRDGVAAAHSFRRVELA